MSTPITTLLRMRDLAQAAAAAPDATHVILAMTPGGEAATFVDEWRYDMDVLTGLYAGKCVIALSPGSAWSIHERAAIELVDAATIEASAVEAVSRIFAAARSPADADERRGYA